MKQVPESVGLPSPAVSTTPQIIYWCQGTWKALTFAFRAIAYRVNRLLPKDGSEVMTRPLPLAKYTTALLPTPALGAGAVAYVTDAVAGAHLQYYTGSIWEPDGLVLAQISGRLIGVQVFSVVGTATYTPTSGTNSVIVEIQAGGGGSGGAGAPSAAQAAIGGSGGGGGYAKKRITTAFSGVTVTVGDGGAAGASGANAGGTGGSSSFGALVSATGGGGGPAGTAAGVGTTAGSAAGGSGSSGDINIDGGGSAAPQIVGITQVVTALGGASPLGGGTRGRGAAGAGQVGLLYGGGANGASAVASGAAVAGAKGGQGIVLVWEYA